MSDKEPHNPKSRLKKWQTTAQAAKLYDCTNQNFRQKAKLLGLKGEKRGTGQSFWWDMHEMFRLSYSVEWVECIIGAQWGKMTRMQFAKLAERQDIERREIGKSVTGKPLYKYRMSDVRRKVREGTNTCEQCGADAAKDLGLRMRVGDVMRRLCRSCACPEMPLTEEDREMVMRGGVSALGRVMSDTGEAYGRDRLSAALDKFKDRAGIPRRKAGKLVTVRT